MSKRILAGALALTLGLALILSFGCAGRSRSARFYVLSPVAAPTGETDNNSGFSRDIAIGISAISLPKYLRKQQIVTRTGSNEVHLAEYDRWAGKIEEDIGRVVAENLARLLATDRVLSYPAMAQGKPDFSITMDISRFEGTLGDTVERVVRWAVTDGQGNDDSGIRSSRIIEPVQGVGYAAFVAAQSRALASFSSELAAALMQLTGG